MAHTDILLVEDDQRLAELTSDYLRQNGFVVEVEGRGDLAVSQFKLLQPKMVLLDLSLPGKDGIEVCRSIREEFNGPILMLTARDTNIDEIIGLEAGADDYITKPADPMVLVARIRAILRRQNPETEEQKSTISIGCLEIKKTSRQVLLDGEDISLTSLEFDLLNTLIANAGNILSRDKLNQDVRGIDYDGVDRTIDVRISRLRKKLGDDLEHPKRIRTVWGKGYLLAPDAW